MRPFISFIIMLSPLAAKPNICLIDKKYSRPEGKVDMATLTGDVTVCRFVIFATTRN